MLVFRRLDLARTRALLADADGNLFPSEEPAFEASTHILNEFLASVGGTVRFTPTALRLQTTGKNFRTTAQELCVRHGLACDTDDLERWVEKEKQVVTEHLAVALGPDPAVLLPVRELGVDLTLAAVSSSASVRLDACFTATALDQLFPRERRYSAEDSLPVPTSKPDPAVYRFAAEQLGVEGPEGLAVEDSVVGAASALAAGHPTIGNVMFVPAEERRARIGALRDAGVHGIIHSWDDLAAQFRPMTRRTPRPEPTAP